MATDSRPGWYQEGVQSINPEAQLLLQTYSGLSADEVLPHVLALYKSQRDKAFQIFPYPCIGQMRFLNFNLSHLAFYPRILKHLQSDPTAGFLDAGCCIGQEIRSLAHAGIPGSQLYGFDLEPGFFDLGYQLFRDQGRLHATLVAGDLGLEENQYVASELVKTLTGKIDIVWAGSLLHFWDYEGQVDATVRLVRMCRDRKGVVVCGRQMGSLFAGMYTLTGLMEKEHYRHNVQSLKGLWFDVAARTQTKWEVEAQLEVGETTTSTKDLSFSDANARVVWWCATRVE
ncbi:hypothetical protein EYZ11_008393 [Aspergillus tanneri]|uniref:Methyltransferase domain-containing protein n=1 Tax=Aspergillus tanneri TaxID=1220188 RepID=A0A4S3JCT6_9EURO|nr:uncharacterized protein ATNIH1004_003749 [Aspergillus tanneri]KAA8651056.1 hypothetical protein ATNIH1004_003749 [Aspergillus tanneri]THC92148.1 hypothetical protein EYZ11_008393 [Aspergillus tanneri]